MGRSQTEFDEALFKSSAWQNGGDASFATLKPSVNLRTVKKKGATKRSMASEKRKKGFSSELPKKMYLYFLGYSDVGAPSFGKFARSIGITLLQLESFKKNGKFEKAWRECSEIRRDYLIDSALTKRHDSSFTKFLLQAEYGMDGPLPTDEESALAVTLEVLEK